MCFARFADLLPWHASALPSQHHGRGLVAAFGGWCQFPNTTFVTISQKMYVQVPGVHEFTTPGIYVTDTFTVALHYATPTRHRDIDIRKVVLANRAPFHHLLLWRALSQADARPHVGAVRASSHCNPAMELKVGISVQHEPGAVCCIIHSV